MVDVTVQPVARTGSRRWRHETLGLLAAGVAHDVNNLLTVIANYAAMATEPRDGACPPDQADWLRMLADMEHIRVAAERGSALTRQLLAYARSPEPQPCDTGCVPARCQVATVVDETLTLVRASIDREIEVLAEHTPCPDALIDPGALSQLLVNLLVNARDALAGCGRITVRTGAVPAATPAQVRLEVVDTGAGIPGELLDRVFEPFFSTKPVGGGCGLGLAMVQETVAAAGGSVRIDSAPGAGTTVIVVLPAG